MTRDSEHYDIVSIAAQLGNLAPKLYFRLAELVLTLNCFSFSGEFYTQTNGVAMGTKMGPNHANLFVGYIGSAAYVAMIQISFRSPMRCVNYLQTRLP